MWCLGGGAIAHRDCLEDWEDEDKCISKNVDEGKKSALPRIKGSGNRKTKMVDGIIVGVIDNASLPVTPFWHTIVESLGRLSWKEMSSVLRFWRSRQRHQERERRREAIIQNQKRVLAEATAMCEANAKTMRGNRPGAAKTLQTLRKEDENGVGGTSENKPTKERRNPAREGGRVKRKRKRPTENCRN